MSRFSGKCDVYDTLIMIHEFTDEELKQNVKLYVGDSEEPLHLETYKDLIPYYPHILCLSYTNNDSHVMTVCISSESFVDREERAFLESYKKLIMRNYNRCKRKKVPFDIEDAVQEASYFGINKDVIRELAQRVAEKGKKASIEGLHLRMHERYRVELVEEMLANGLNPADYGYGRFVEDVATTQ